jgi:hypothetical protein
MQPPHVEPFFTTPVLLKPEEVEFSLGNGGGVIVVLSAEAVVLPFQIPGFVAPLLPVEPAVGNKIPNEEFDGPPSDGAGFSSGALEDEVLLMTGLIFGKSDGPGISEEELCSVDELDEFDKLDKISSAATDTPVLRGIGIGASDPVPRGIGIGVSDDCRFGNGGGDDIDGRSDMLLLELEDSRSEDACAGKDCDEDELKSGRRQLALL